ncbi:MAG: BNR repeat-containing protein [Granulosicoccus sp.]
MPESRLVSVAEGWSKTAVNATRHREHPLVSHLGIQYVGFYDADANLVLGKRDLNDTDWTLTKTPYQGNAADEHNTVNLGIDGAGLLHIAWDHHGNSLNYVQTIEPDSLELGLPTLLIGTLEEEVTYPGFHALPNGDMLMSYRDGGSGRGSMVLNYYDHLAASWSRLHDTLIDGEGQRNPYWQMHVDKQGVVHVSWVWRESSNASTNHDMMYARSSDAGQSWQDSRGRAYTLPITEATAELVWSVPQSTNLINQTSMTANQLGHPRIATYFREEGQSVTQLQLITFDGNTWQVQPVTDRSTDFELGGTGTRVLPLSRPLIVSEQVDEQELLHVVYRDAETGSHIMLATGSVDGDWTHKMLSDFPVGRWEPGYDPLLWRDKSLLHVFVQNIVGVGDLLPDNTLATEESISPHSPISVLEVSTESSALVPLTAR